jgi:hypothetical protein
MNFTGGHLMQTESVRSVATRLESYFEWYVRIDPEVPSAVWSLLSRFSALVEGPADAAAAKELLDETRAFSLGSPWEELRLALAQLAHAKA